MLAAAAVGCLWDGWPCQMKRLIVLSVNSAWEHLQKSLPGHRAFHVFGYDFMIDDDWKVKRTAPSLQYQSLTAVTAASFVSLPSGVAH